MLREMTTEGFQIPIYTRHVDDIYFIVWGSRARVRQRWKRIVQGLNSMDGPGGSIEVEGESVEAREGEKSLGKSRLTPRGTY